MFVPPSIDLDYSSNQLALREFSRPQQVHSAPLDPGGVEKQNRQLAAPEIQLASFRKFDPLKDLKPRILTPLDWKKMQAEFDRTQRIKRNSEIAEKSQKLYDNKVLTDKDQKPFLDHLLVQADQNKGITRNGKAVEDFPEIVIQALTAMNESKMLTPKELEAILFEPDAKAPLIMTMNIFTGFVRAIQAELPEGKDFMVLAQSDKPEDAKLLRDAIAKVRPKMLKATGLDKLK